MVSIAYQGTVESSRWLLVWLGLVLWLALRYLSWAYPKVNRKLFLLLFIPQWILNVGWNYVFFNQQLIDLGVIVLILLTGIVYTTLIMFHKTLNQIAVNCALLPLAGVSMFIKYLHRRL